MSSKDYFLLFSYNFEKLLFTLYFKVLFMNQEQDYLQDISQIRSMMEKSTRFISLSGLSGVFAGVVGLVGAGIAHWMIDEFNNQHVRVGGDWRYSDTTSITTNLLLLAVVVLILALCGGYYFTARKAKKINQKIWSKQTQVLLINLFIPLIAGGLFCCAMLYHRIIGLVAPSMLIFYGLALVNSSKYTLNDIRFLGIAEIILGIVALFFIGYGLFFWAFGFGVLHIAYGVSMYYKYEYKR